MIKQSEIKNFNNVRDRSRKLNNNIDTPHKFVRNLLQTTYKLYNYQLYKSHNLISKRSYTKNSKPYIKKIRIQYSIVSQNYCFRFLTSSTVDDLVRIAFMLPKIMVIALPSPPPNVLSDRVYLLRLCVKTFTIVDNHITRG